VIANALCRQLLEERGIPSLETARKQNPIFKQVKIILPHFTFDQGVLTLRVGKKNLTILPSPGHSPDGVSVLVEEDRVLFAGDAFMPLPYVADGDAEDITSSIKKFSRMGLENIIQGHGDIVLRGEIEAAVKENLAYLANIRKVARTALRRRAPQDFLDENSVETCGKSRVHLGGLAEELHRRNLRALYQQERQNEGK
jgi:glyoxylase-like metal-dependent hydrolase (beta-lactamase superfamily II)